jgi:hypothetical protein
MTTLACVCPDLFPSVCPSVRLSACLPACLLPCLLACAKHWTVLSVQDVGPALHLRLHHALLRTLSSLTEGRVADLVAEAPGEPARAAMLMPRQNPCAT